MSLRVLFGAAVLLSSVNLGVSFAEEKKPWLENTSALGQIKQRPFGIQTKKQFKQLREVGKALFDARFTTLDGAGRPKATGAILPTKTKHAAKSLFSRTSGSDANSCSSCHNQPFIGGAGDFVMNVFVAEGFNNHDFQTIDPEFSNERGSNHIFGAGLLEMLAREMSADLIALRKKAIKDAKIAGKPVLIKLESKGVSYGSITAAPDGIVDLSQIEGVDTDLVIRPLSQKGVMTSLRQFTINAMNDHHGMQSVERWGARWTGEEDFDEDGKKDELSSADISALVAWQASLPAPLQTTPNNKEWQKLSATGAGVFNDIGCSECHRTSLPLKSLSFQDPGPLDVSGTLKISDVEEVAIYDLEQLEWAMSLPRNDKGEVLVPLFGDLKRHKITDAQVAGLGNELFSQRFVGRDVFMTAELWGVGSTSPYGHRNDITTLDEIIREHGGEARKARDAYVNADAGTREAIVAFLKTLEITKEK